VFYWFASSLITDPPIGTLKKWGLGGINTHTRNKQGDHFSGKPGNVREFDKNQEIVREKLPKTIYCKLHFFVHTGI